MFAKPAFSLDAPPQGTFRHALQGIGSEIRRRGCVQNPGQTWSVLIARDLACVAMSPFLGTFSLSRGLLFLILWGFPLSWMAFCGTIVYTRAVKLCSYIFLGLLVVSTSILVLAAYTALVSSSEKEQLQL